MTPRLVTVFGGSGFIGRNFVRLMAKTGAQIRVAVRNPSAALFLRPMGDVGQIVPVQANLRAPETVTAACQGAEIVVNLVGILYERGRQTFHTIHDQGARIIATAAKAAGAHQLLHISALGASLNAASRYARSKAAGEAAVRTAFPNATVFRPSVVFGPDDQFFNRFATLASFLPALPLIGGGKTKVQPVYVGDVAAALMQVITTPALQGKTYDLGGPRSYSWKEIMTLVCHETHRDRMLIPLPYSLAMIEAFFLEFLPIPPLTRDQVRLLKTDNVLNGENPGLEALDISPTAVEALVPTYLYRFRPGGQFAEENKGK
ncbi:MAG: complex I NDUFA9 subunit family protein [Alphaproteobacteria bacterium]